MFAPNWGASAPPNRAGDLLRLITARRWLVGRQDQQGKEVKSTLVSDGQLPLAGAPEYVGILAQGSASHFRRLLSGILGARKVNALGKGARFAVADVEKIARQIPASSRSDRGGVRSHCIFLQFSSVRGAPSGPSHRLGGSISGLLAQGPAALLAACPSSPGARLGMFSFFRSRPRETTIADLPQFVPAAAKFDLGQAGAAR